MGQGVRHGGSRALLDKAFTELGVRVVWGATMARNVPSQKVMEKLGMTVAETLETPEDMLMVEGAELGGLRYEITQEQWAAAVGAASRVTTAAGRSVGRRRSRPVPA